MPIYRNTWRDQVQEKWNEKKGDLGKYRQDSLDTLKEIDRLLNEKIKEIEKGEGS